MVDDLTNKKPNPVKELTSWIVSNFKERVISQKC